MSSPRAQSVVPGGDNDHLMESDRASSNSGSDSDNDNDSDGDDGEPVVWLVNNREKRTTAGNRLSTLIQQAAAEDDELNLLFEEPEDEVDEGFEEGEDDASDVQMDSSDDDDDQGPTAGAEEFEGEKELQRAERQSKKRKADDGIPKAFRKKVKIDPTAPLAPPPRPKKKSERASWIPAVADGPTRASSRSTTKESKEQLHVQMIEREKKRLKQLKSMEKAAATRNANKAKELTQEDRLKEAARMEKYNSKSLNKWEEAEKLREEERRQKLEDLHNRQLEGPVITWWSGKAEWVNGKLYRVGKVLVEDKPKPTTTYMTKKRKAELEAGGADSSSKAMAADLTPMDGVNATGPALSSTGQTTDGTFQTSVASPAPYGCPPYASTAAHSRPLLVSRDDVQKPPSSADIQTESNNGTLSDVPPTISIQLAASPAQEPSIQSTTTTAVPTEPLPPPTASHTPLNNSAIPNPSASSLPPPPRLAPSPDVPFTFTQIQPQKVLPEVPVAPVIEHSTRNCIILENFDEAAIKDKGTQTQILFGRNTARVPKVYKTPSKHPLHSIRC